MKKIFLLAAFAALTMGAQAQESRKISKEDRMEKREKMTPDERADHQADMMQKRLKLTDAQTAKIREINVKTMPDKSQMTDDRKEMRQERMELMKKREEMYGQVLTKEQLDEFRAFKKERMSDMKARHLDHKKDRKQRLDNEVK